MKPAIFCIFLQSHWKHSSNPYTHHHDSSRFDWNMHAIPQCCCEIQPSVRLADKLQSHYFDSPQFYPHHTAQRNNLRKKLSTVIKRTAMQISNFTHCVCAYHTYLSTLHLPISSLKLDIGARPRSMCLDSWNDHCIGRVETLDQRPMLNSEMLAHFARTLIRMNDTHELEPHFQANNDPTPTMIVSTNFATLYIDPWMSPLSPSPHYRIGNNLRDIWTFLKHLEKLWNSNFFWLLTDL